MRPRLAAFMLSLAACGSPPLTRAPIAEPPPTLAAAERLLEAGRPGGALVMLHALHARGGREEGLLYAAARAAAEIRAPADALMWLGRLADSGYDDPASLAADEDLASLRGDPGFDRVLTRVAANATNVREPALRRELAEMFVADQAARAPLATGRSLDAADMQRLTQIDAQTTARMKAIVDRYGWPGKTLVGRTGSKHAWLLVQHADADPEFQRRVLALLTAAVAQGEARAPELALLTDRVLVNADLPQRYGTQFHEQGGVMVPLPLEDPSHVDARRAAMGLPSLAAYADEIGRALNKPTRVP